MRIPPILVAAAAIGTLLSASAAAASERCTQDYFRIATPGYNGKGDWNTDLRPRADYDDQDIPGKALSMFVGLTEGDLRHIAQYRYDHYGVMINIYKVMCQYVNGEVTVTPAADAPRDGTWMKALNLGAHHVYIATDAFAPTRKQSRTATSVEQWLRRKSQRRR